MPQNVMQNGLSSKSQILDQPKEVSSSNSLEILLSREHKQYSREIEECFGGLNVSVNPSYTRLSAEELPMQIIISLGTGIAGSAIYDLLKAGIKMVFRKFENAKVSLRDKENIMYSVLSDEKVKVIVVPEKEQRFSQIKHLDDLIKHLCSINTKSIWEEMTLGKAVEKFIDYRGKTPRKTSFGIPLITAKIVKDGRIMEVGEFISEEDYPKWMTRGFPKKSDVILTTEAPLGEVAQITDEKVALAQRIIVLRANPKYLVNDFLRYSLQSPIMQHRLRGRQSGSTVSGIKSSELKKVEIPLPPLPEQRAIANVLASLDDKIELLRSQNKRLEEISQTLFDEWFVDFNFPNAQGKPYKKSGGEMVDSELGQVPDGWRLGKLADEFKIVMGQSPGGESYNQDKQGMIFFQGRAEFKERFPEIRLYTTDPKRIAEKFDVLVSVRAPVGDINVAFTKCCIGRGLAAVRSDNKSYALYKIKYLQNIFQKFEAQGTVFGSIGKDDFAKIVVLIPKKELIESFEALAHPIDQKIFNNYIQIQTLSTLRDELLPRLMRGDLRVGKNNNETLFTDDLPFVTTNQALEEVKKMYPNYDEYYVTSGCLPDRRKRFDVLWQQFKPHADSHFLKQYKSQFHQRSWEMYVGCVLLQNGFSIKSLDEGLDFVVNDDTYVECVACNNAEKGKADYVPDLITGIAQDVPWRQMMLRITSVIRGKYENHHKKWFDKNKPFIIAVNSGVFSFPQDYLGIPLIIRALFGLEFLQVNQNHESSFSWKNNIKKGDSLVPVDYFTNDLFKEISGVIFSDGNILNHPDHIGDDCVFVNNPYASHPVPADQFPFLKRWHADRDKLTKLY